MLPSCALCSIIGYSPECDSQKFAGKAFSEGSPWVPLGTTLYRREALRSGKVSKDEEQGLGGLAGNDARRVPSASPRVALGCHRRGGAQALARRRDRASPHVGDYPHRSHRGLRRGDLALAGADGPLPSRLLRRPLLVGLLFR